ncbi:type II toxin-antitoxin system RelE family toxin [Propionibacterium sp.]|uniref:type II toxin-antitoxin system RelE family toxin n=1 Tax=Propionibacterium sp. TaxID=1977903 RepID=UPI0039EB33FA
MESQRAWSLRYSPRAAKALRKLDHTVARHIVTNLERLTTLDEPTAPCKALSGPLTGLWRLRVGDWRVILDIDRAQLSIVAVDIGNRSTIYT